MLLGSTEAAIHTLDLSWKKMDVKLMMMMMMMWLSCWTDENSDADHDWCKRSASSSVPRSSVGQGARVEGQEKSSKMMVQFLCFKMFSEFCIHCIFSKNRGNRWCFKSWIFAGMAEVFQPGASLQNRNIEVHVCHCFTVSKMKMASLVLIIFCNDGAYKCVYYYYFFFLTQFLCQAICTQRTPKGPK